MCYQAWVRTSPGRNWLWGSDFKISTLPAQRKVFQEPFGCSKLCFGVLSFFNLMSNKTEKLDRIKSSLQQGSSALVEKGKVHSQFNQSAIRFMLDAHNKKYDFGAYLWALVTLKKWSIHKGATLTNLDQLDMLENMYDDLKTLMWFLRKGPKFYATMIALLCRKFKPVRDSLEIVEIEKKWCEKNLISYEECMSKLGFRLINKEPFSSDHVNEVKRKLGNSSKTNHGKHKI